MVLIMTAFIQDVAEHFNCSLILADKIIRLLMKSSNVCMKNKGVVDFKFCGILYTLSRSEDDWVMVRSMVTRSTDLDDLL